MSAPTSAITERRFGEPPILWAQNAAAAIASHTPMLSTHTGTPSETAEIEDREHSRTARRSAGFRRSRSAHRGRRQPGCTRRLRHEWPDIRKATESRAFHYAPERTQPPPAIRSQGPQPDPGRVDVFTGVQSVQIARFRERIGQAGRRVVTAGRYQWSLGSYLGAAGRTSPLRHGGAAAATPRAGPSETRSKLLSPSVKK
jgi:hypothetical protein